MTMPGFEVIAVDILGEDSEKVPALTRALEEAWRSGREACVSELRLMATGADENHDAYVARCLEVAANALQSNGETAR